MTLRDTAILSPKEPWMSNQIRERLFALREEVLCCTPVATHPTLEALFGEADYNLVDMLDAGQVQIEALKAVAAFARHKQPIPKGLALLAYGGDPVPPELPAEADSGLAAIRSELDTYRSSYLGQGAQEPPTGWRGVWRARDPWVGLYRPVLEQVLVAAGLEALPLINAWRDDGTLVLGKDRLQIDVKIGGVKHRVVAFKKSALGLDPAT